jgi:hypothetical protein
MKFAIDLTEAQSTALIARAKTLGVAPEERLTRRCTRRRGRWRSDGRRG